MTGSTDSRVVRSRKVAAMILKHGPCVPMMYLEQRPECVRMHDRVLSGRLDLLNWLNTISGADGALPIVHHAHHLLPITRWRSANLRC